MPPRSPSPRKAKAVVVATSNPLATFHKMAAFEPPPSVTKRGLSITFSSSMRHVHNMQLRAVKMLKYVEGVINQALTVSSGCEENMAKNPSIAFSGSLAATAVQGALRELDKVCDIAVKELTPHRDELKRLAGAMERACTFLNEHSGAAVMGDPAKALTATKSPKKKSSTALLQALVPEKPSPAVAAALAAALQTALKEASALADESRDVCVAALAKCREHSSKIEDTRALLQRAGTMLIADVPGPEQPLPCPVRWPENLFSEPGFKKEQPPPPPLEVVPEREFELPKGWNSPVKPTPASPSIAAVRQAREAMMRRVMASNESSARAMPVSAPVSAPTAVATPSLAAAAPSPGFGLDPGSPSIEGGTLSPSEGGHGEESGEFAHGEGEEMGEEEEEGEEDEGVEMGDEAAEAGADEATPAAEFEQEADDYAGRELDEFDVAEDEAGEEAVGDEQGEEEEEGEGEGEADGEEDEGQEG